MAKLMVETIIPRRKLVRFWHARVSRPRRPSGSVVSPREVPLVFGIGRDRHVFIADIMASIFPGVVGLVALKLIRLMSAIRGVPGLFRPRSGH